MALGCGRVSHVDVFALNARNTYTKSTVQLYGAAVWCRSFAEEGRGVGALGPVLRQLSAHEGEDVRAEVGDRDSGQDQEARVIDYDGQVLLTQLRRPSDEAVAWRKLPCRGAGAEHGERPAVAVVDRGAGLRTDQGLVTEIVVPCDGLIPSLALVVMLRTGRRVGVRVSSRMVGAGNSGGSVSGPKVIGLASNPRRRRHDDEAVAAVHGHHGNSGHHVLEPAIRLKPADALAELVRQRGAVLRRGGGDQRAQQRHLPGGEVAPVVAALDLGDQAQGLVLSNIMEKMNVANRDQIRERSLPLCEVVST